MSINNLKSQIFNRKSTIGIIGLGYVGLPLAIRFSEEGFRVIGFDVDGKKVQMLNSGQSYIKHIDGELIDTAVKNGFKATSDFSHIPSTAAILICVPTPLGVHNEPDLSYIHSTLQSIKPHLKENQLLVLESTTYPGTTEEEIVPVVEKQT
jgi:UDP-N-acetyl-D-mannosaminuronate dehydrogenase